MRLRSLGVVDGLHKVTLPCRAPSFEQWIKYACFFAQVIVSHVIVSHANVRNLIKCRIYINEHLLIVANCFSVDDEDSLPNERSSSAEISAPFYIAPRIVRTVMYYDGSIFCVYAVGFL